MNRKYLLAASALVIVILVANWNAQSDANRQPVSDLDNQLKKVVRQTVDQGRQVFRFDTFGDESFWGDKLRLHQAIEGTFGGVGRGLSPKTIPTEVGAIVWKHGAASNGWTRNEKENGEKGQKGNRRGRGSHPVV